MIELFLPADLLYTFFFRYPRMCANDIPGDSSTNGPPIDFTSTHWLETLFITLAIGAFSAINFYREYCNQKKAKLNNSPQFILSELERQGDFGQDEDDELAQEIEEKLELLPKQSKTQWLKDAIAKMYATDPALQAKYEGIEFDEKNNCLNFKLRPKDAATLAAEAKKKAEAKPGWFRRYVINKVVSPLWEALGISSYAYWILWIGAGLFTGKFDTGVVGVSPTFAFGIPFAFGVMYMAIKSYNWYKHNYAAQQKPSLDGDRPATLEETISTQRDACEILRKAVLQRRFELLEDRFKRELGVNYREPVEEKAVERSATLEAEIDYLGQDKKTKAVTTGVSTTIGTFIGTQYGTWIVADVLAKVFNVVMLTPVVNVVLGWTYMIGSALYGIYNAVKRYGSVKEQRETLDQELAKAGHAVDTLEDRYKAKVARIDALKAELKGMGGNPRFPESVRFDQPQFFSDVKRNSPTTGWTTVKRYAMRAFQFLNGFTGGAMIARIFFVKGTAIVLPFAAAALSNPVTMALVFGIGFAYGIFKAYQYHKQRKELHAKEALQQRSERIACLKKQCRLADVAIQVLEHRIQQVKEHGPQVAVDTGVDVEDNNAKKKSSYAHTANNRSRLYSPKAADHALGKDVFAASALHRRSNIAYSQA